MESNKKFLPKMDQEMSTRAHASSSKLRPKEEEREVNEIASDDEGVVDNSFLPKIGFVNENPYFLSKARRFHHLYVPRKFMSDHGSKLGEVVKIYDPLGRITKVILFEKKVGQFFLKGWHAVCKLNSMCDGDKFVCELVQGNSKAETYIKLHLNLHKVSNLIKRSSLPLKDHSSDHVTRKHKGSSEMSKEQRTHKPEVYLVNINGYKVKPTTAPILSAIFAKHGDITANCSCKSLSAKTSLLEVLCDIIQRLRYADIETILSSLEIIENEVFDLKLYNVNVAWLHKHLENLRKVAACRDESSKLKNHVQQSVLELSSLNKEVEQMRAEMAKAYEMFKEAEQRETDKKLVIRKIEENVLRLEAEKALLIHGLLNELP